MLLSAGSSDSLSTGGRRSYRAVLGSQWNWMEGFPGSLLPPHKTRIPSPITNTLLHMLQLTNLHWHITVAQSPQFMLEFTLGGIHPRCLCAQPCLTLCRLQPHGLWPAGTSPSGSSVRGIFQARRVESVAISYSRGSSQPRDGITPLAPPALAGGFLTTGPLGKPLAFYEFGLIYSDKLQVLCLVSYRAASLS